MLRKSVLLKPLFAGVLACFSLGTMAQAVADYQVIPLPQSIQLAKTGQFLLADGVKITYPAGNDLMKNNAEFLAEYVQELIGVKLVPVAEKAAKGAINLAIKPQKNKEAFTVKVDAMGVTITGASEAGVFYGIQMLRKSLPAEATGSVNLPYATVSDAPRFEYRGMMLDCSRHFFPVEFIKRYIDILALHGENNFHWHLTDDQGWRFEVKRYPLLTQVGSKRAQTVIGHNTGIYDGTPYGGYYTQDECREIVAYAKKRYINVMPEIDMPGHMLGALAAYPELGCHKDHYDVWQIWGVSADVLCVGNPKTLEFIKGVLEELIDVFPSQMIHVGGDECPKTAWKTCPTCQAKAKELGLVATEKHSVEEQLQSYFIKEMEKFLNEHGRSMIGWDETLEGGLAPNASIMSWRGLEGGIEAARQHHNVVMTPTSFCYFDYYQSNDKKNEPIAIGGYLPVSRVYEFNPVPDELTPEEQQYIKGCQANLWVEYIPDGNQVEYMVMPRMAALCETQWMDRSAKNYDSFVKRIPKLFATYTKLGYNFAKHLLDVNGLLTSNPEEKCMELELFTADKMPVHYTLDGSVPTKDSPVFQQTLKLRQDSHIRAVAVRDGVLSSEWTERVKIAKSSFKPVSLKLNPAPNYTYNGAKQLTDAIHGTSTFSMGAWLGFNGDDCVATIDMGQATAVSTCSARVLVETSSWVFDANQLMVECSDNGQTWKKVGETFYQLPSDHETTIRVHKLDFPKITARYFRVTLGTVKAMPSFHDGKGKPAYLFVDEIELD